MGKEYGQNMLTVLDFITDSLMLDTPMISNDPAYQQLEDRIPSIINMVLLESELGDIESLTGKDIHYVVLKSLHTLYLRLATAVAPEFEGSAEQVTFKKGQRFAHYSTLADKIQKEIDEKYPGYIESANVRIVARNGTRRNYNLGKEQPVNLYVGVPTTNSVELGWEMFNLSYGDFAKYVLMYGTEQIYDEYAAPKFNVTQQTFIRNFYDIRRTKFRLTELTPNTHYFILVMLVGKDGVKSVEQIEIDTDKLEEEVPEEPNEGVGD